MEQNKVMLLVTAVFGALAILFAIIGVATEGWPSTKTQLFRLGNVGGYNYTAAGVLLIIGIVFTAIAILLAILFLTQFISSSADRIKGLALALLVLAGIFIVAAYSRAVFTDFYSYHLAVTSGTLVFVSTIFFTYWIGHTSITHST